MARLFLVLAVLNAITLLAGAACGTAWKLQLTFVQNYDASTLWMVHFYLGLSSAVLTLLVHCLIFTYFLGTGRWVKEVAIAYQLPDQPLPKLTRDLKRRAYPAALFAMLVPIATVAAGAGAQLQAWPWPVHATLAGFTLLINFWAFVVEYRCVVINGGVITQVMQEVERLRAEQGLPSNTEALREQNAL